MGRERERDAPENCEDDLRRARGVAASPQQRAARDAWLCALRALWRDLRFGGPGGTCRPLRPNDLDFIVSADEILDRHLDRLCQLGRGVWLAQERGLASE